MKKLISITNADNEVVKLSVEQFSTFLDLVNIDDNISRCEIFCEKEGWYYLESALEEKEGMSIEEMKAKHDIDEVLINYFENNLFANELHV